MKAAAYFGDDKTDVDAVVLKRLKFVFKIIKSLSLQTNTRNRQAPVYILEVLDAIGDWSGNPNTEITELLDNQIFPHICRFISTFSKDEFNSFQQFFCKYIFSKWGETSNFLVLDFLSEIYGFIASIAPLSVSVELVHVFQQEEIPSHVSLVILPSLLRNVPDAVANDVSDKISRNFLLKQRNDVSTSAAYLKIVVQFWTNLKNTISKTKNLYQLAPVLQRCIVTSSSLEVVGDIDILKVLQSLSEWSNNLSGAKDLEGFILVSTIFLHSVCSAMLKKQNDDIFTSVTGLMKCVIDLTETCSNRHIRVFATRVLQRTLEYAAEDGAEILDEFVKKIEKCEDFEIDDENENNNLFDALESSLKQFSSAVKTTKLNDAERKKIMHTIDSLQKLVENSD